LARTAVETGKVKTGETIEVLYKVLIRNKQRKHVAIYIGRTIKVWHIIQVGAVETGKKFKKRQHNGWKIWNTN
jgi:hypothetical protein